MSDRDSHGQRVKRLLAQDPAINDTQMKEFRMRLEQTLGSFEAKAKQTRRRILIAWLTYLICVGTSFVIMSYWGSARHSPITLQVRQVVLITVLFLALLSMILGVLLLVLYLAKYGPRLSRARYELQSFMLLDLQQQLQQIRERLDRQEK